MSPSIDYAIEPDLSVDEFIDVLVRSTLAERRPVDDRARIARMLSEADVIVTARLEGRLVGISRALTDYGFCTFLSDLAVDESLQRQGIGRELIRRTHEAGGLHSNLILLAAPKAETYYPHIGMTKHGSCWIIPRRT
jgi:predicted N-acetyltransferase YhbS